MTDKRVCFDFEESRSRITIEEKHKRRTAAVSHSGPRNISQFAAQADALEGIRQGLEDVKKGRVRLAREFFAEFETRRGLPR